MKNIATVERKSERELVVLRTFNKTQFAQLDELLLTLGASA